MGTVRHSRFSKVYFVIHYVQPNIFNMYVILADVDVHLSNQKAKTYTVPPDSKRQSTFIKLANIYCVNSDCVCYASYYCFS